MYKRCVFDGNIITCKDIISGKIDKYSINDQHKIQYLDTYKKTNDIIIIIKLLLFLLLFLISLNVLNKMGLI